jgi:SPP1 family predicted phage head-tail adaptor
MRAGRLRHRMLFEKPGPEELDSDGAQVETWLPEFNGRLQSVEIVAMSGRELIAAQATQSKVTTRIKARYRREYKASMRGNHRGTIYNIEAVIPDPDSGARSVTLLCSSGVNEG